MAPLPHPAAHRATMPLSFRCVPRRRATPSAVTVALVAVMVLSACNGCGASESTDASAFAADAHSDPSTDNGPDTAHDGAEDADERGLRPNVQADQPPNAEGQTPAFEGQTRARQPASATAVTRTVIAEGLEIPWGIAPLPDGRLLVTERAGQLRIVGTDGAVSAPLGGVPEVAAFGQGGLLDVALGPDFATTRAVFLTYAEDRGDGNTAPAVARAILSADLSRLDEVRVLYRQEPPRRETRHYGSRIVFDETGAMFVTFGDRGGGFEDAQSPFNGIGAVIRILPDGSIPDDNPFRDGEDGDPAVWSWGHRNIQSATLDRDGALWTVEHGPQGGDELNQPEAGVNHGWPLISYGENYNGQPIEQGLTAREGLAQPVYYWDPVIAPSDMLTYTGELFDTWDGDLLIGGLRALSVVRLTLRDGRVDTEEWIPMEARVRSLALAADGAVLVGTDAGQIVALRPASE